MSTWYDEQKAWVLHTGSLSDTHAIALSFVFIAYFLHPTVQKAYQRVRAYQGWRAIKAGQTVEVTSYPLVSEIFFGRGRWDATRIVAILMAAFSVASWGLELQMDLAHVDDFIVDLLLRPPPVWKNPNVTGDAWYVIRPDELDIVEGEVHNMDGNFSVGTANARYKVKSIKGIVDGKVRIASWNTNKEDMSARLFYDRDGIGYVTSTNCFSDEPPVSLYVDGEGEPWGVVVDCKDGPRMVNGETSSTTPVVKLVNATGGVHLIVEERSTYPTSLYSVWKAQTATDGSTTLHHVFHISSSVRLVEAVVTEIVHADKEGKDPTGGRSFALLRVFSENNSSYDVDIEDRASPFEEAPTGEIPVALRISNLETIEDGVMLYTTALVCFILLIVSALVGITWSLVLHSSIDMDIYNRDELIRSVTMAGSADGAEHSSKMRIFVRKGGGGSLSVAVTNDEFHPTNCLQRCRKQHKAVAFDYPVPNCPSHDSCESGSPTAPSRPRMMWLEGVRMAEGRAYPGRRGNYRYPSSIAFSASPAPSNIGSVAETPVHRLTSPVDVSPRIKHFLGVNPALFFSLGSLRGNCKDGGEVEMIATRRDGEQKAKPCNETDYQRSHRSEYQDIELLDLRGRQLVTENTATLHDQSPIPPHVGLASRSACETSGTSRTPPSDPVEDTKNPYNLYREAGVAKTEGGVAHDGDNEVV